MSESKVSLYRISELHAWRLDTELLAGVDVALHKREESKEIRLKVPNHILSDFVGPRDLFNLLSQEATYKVDLLEIGIRDYGNRFVAIKLKQKSITEDGLILLFEILSARKNSFEFSLESSVKTPKNAKALATSQFWI